MRYYISLIALLLLSCSKTQTAAPAGQTGQTLRQHLEDNYDFSEFYAALQRVHLDTLLDGGRPYTLLVPDNVALQAAGVTADSLNRMDTAQLRLLLAYHILPGEITYSAIPQALDYVYKNLEGLPLYFSQPIPGNNVVVPPNYQLVAVNGVPFSSYDILATNGVIQVLSQPLRYPAPSVKSILQDNPQYSFFAEALRRFGLLDALDSTGPYVVLAPDNAVFASHGITLDSIDRMNGTTYYPYLFGADLLPDKFFFQLDVSFGPQEVTGSPVNESFYVTQNYALGFTANGNFTGGTITVTAFPLVYLMDQQQNVYRGAWGDGCVITDPDHLALNGVVHGVDGLLINPDSALVVP